MRPDEATLEVQEGADGRLSHSHTYPRLDKWFLETPWAITKSMMNVISEIRQVRLAGQRFTVEEIEQRIDARGAARPARRAGAIAVIPLYGVIVPKATMMTAMSGGMTLQDFRGMLRGAVDDPDVAAILIDVDSPGGSVDQVPETAAEIRGAAARKPVWAIANTDCYSAAYWLAAQASQLWVTPSGGVGSVGVYAVHEDWSGYNEKAGVAPTYISFGDHKTDGNPDEPLAGEALAKIQADVNTYGAMFVADIAKGRNVTRAVVEETFGQGATVLARDAVSRGMADRVGTFDQAVQELARAPRSGGGAHAEIDGGTPLATDENWAAVEPNEDPQAVVAAALDDVPAAAATVDQLVTL